MARPKLRLIRGEAGDTIDPANVQPGDTYWYTSPGFHPIRVRVSEVSDDDRAFTGPGGPHCQVEGADIEFWGWVSIERLTRRRPDA